MSGAVEKLSISESGILGGLVWLELGLLMGLVGGLFESVPRALEEAFASGPGVLDGLFE